MTREAKPEWKMTDQEADEVFRLKFAVLHPNELDQIARKWRSLRKIVSSHAADGWKY